ncbi:hypothetical protein HGRIS_005872 [Hohenbuehelia grisea]|uniref:RNA polymerase II-associated protein 3 n=1 Tax=Hohenbuehelia grisea TaxID=104357 RepID=A0ABR3JYL2_9AGAR
MDVQKAQQAKEKGNAAFKVGDYLSAIGHYTTAIINNRDDATYPLNRAAAYLKLGKNQDAERDCTTALELIPRNAKALFRRGQARFGTGKLYEAQTDFGAALNLEPSNESIKLELQKLEAVIANSSSKPAAALKSIIPAPSNASVPKRRRVPITILDSSQASSSQSPPANGGVQGTPSIGNTLLTPVSSRSLNASSGVSPPKPSTGNSSVAPPSATVPKTTDSATPSPTPVPPKPSSFKDAKSARESAKTSRVGGGIFRANGSSTIFTHLGDTTSDKTSAEKPLGPKPDIFAAPKPQNSRIRKTPQRPLDISLVEFEKAWRNLASPAERWDFFSVIAPLDLPSLFQTSLEPALFVSILETFLAVLDSQPNDTKGLITEYLEAFPKVPRFSTVLLFLNAKEKSVAKEVWKRLGVQNPAPSWKAISML